MRLPWKNLPIPLPPREHPIITALLAARDEIKVEEMAHKTRADGSRIPTGLEADAALIGFKKVHDVEHNATRWTVVCQGCGTPSAHGWPTATSPTNMARNMVRLGWIVDRKVQKCLECIEKERPVKAPVIAGPDPKIARRIYAALDEHFDEAKRLYRSGWDDLKVAASLEVSAEIVIRIRKEAYGDLAEDPIFQTLRDDLEMLRMEGAELGIRMASQIEEHHAKITALEVRIASAPALRKAVC